MMFRDGDFASADSQKIYEKYNTTRDGLTSNEVSNRQTKYGFNEITEKKQILLLKFLKQFWGPIPVMIEIAAALSLLVHDTSDFIIIMILLLMNSLVSFWHDHKADNAIELLKKKLAPQAKVMRDKKWVKIPSRELVPGDIIKIRLGDTVPADVILIDGEYLECDESSLTGESLPADKTKFDEAYSGSTVLKGDMKAVVKSTGFDTFIGKTAKLVDETKDKSHFEKAVIKIGNYLIVLAGILVAVIIIMALFRHDNFLETLRFAMVLTVASIPVALPAILTVTMAVGAVNLTKKGAIVSKLASIEELAGVDVLCSDKTGTLTKNKLTPSNPISAGNFSQSDVLIYACLASQKDVNDAIDDAIFRAAEKKGEIFDSLSNYKTVNFTPFDPVIKRSEASVSLDNSDPFKVTKGAPQVIFDLIKDKNFNRKEWEEKVNELAGKGYRVLGIAAQLENDNWKFIGLTPLFDPPRDDSADTINNANEMGINVKMITGDNRAIAKEIAKKLGMKSNITRGGEIKFDSIPRFGGYG